MKKVVFIVLVSCVLTEASVAQTVQQTLRANNRVQRLNMSNGIISSNDLIIGFDNSAAGEVVGDPYVDSHWGISSIQLEGEAKLVEGMLTRFDILSNELEFKLQEGIRVLPGSKIANVVWVDSVTQRPRFLYNGKNFKLDGAPVDGFLELLVDGSVALYRKYYVEVLKPNFSPALNVGSKDTKVLRKYWLVFAQDGNLHQVKSRKSLDQLNPELRANANKIVEQHKLNLKNETDVVRLFTLMTQEGKN
jgi:hypothetical protein